MKQSLQLRIGQNLTMTPQLQQAIKLLQLSTLDLQQEIQQALESNIMLEVDEDVVDTNLPKTKEQTDITSEGTQSEIPVELPVDSNWEDVFENCHSPTTVSNVDNSEFESQQTKSENLLDYLLEQLNLISMSERDRAIAVAIIDAINDEGYLSDSIETIYNGLQSQLDDLEFDEVQAVLHQIQNFDPPGVAAKDLADCLLIQLQQLDKNTPYRDEAIDLVKRHLDLLVTHEQARIIRRLGLTEQQFGQVIALIRTLDPKPGTKMQVVSANYIVPDVFVSKHKGRWQVRLNQDIAPNLRINSTYSKMIKRADKSEQNTHMKAHLQDARWFIKSLHSRNETLLQVAKVIVEKQQGFLENGAIAMKPMVLRNIAEELELHESTISRITTQKYMHTPNGIVEFKYFFSSHVATETGGECSAVAIRAFIKELIDSENPVKPLSDNKISKLLEDKGIHVARRTIAKYREAMLIPSSSQRKRLLS